MSLYHQGDGLGEFHLSAGEGERGESGGGELLGGGLAWMPCITSTAVALMPKRHPRGNSKEIKGMGEWVGIQEEGN